MTIALISRQGTTMGKSYIDFLVGWEIHDPWSFYELAGCPGALIVQISKLTQLAEQREIALSMEWLTFNEEPVWKIHKEIAEWNDESFQLPSNTSKYEHLADADAEELIHEQHDRYHCVEAWRYALLLYIERLFGTSSRPLRRLEITISARQILDHVRCCRQSSQAQKQLLLPVFLAGSEAQDEEPRQFANDYCLFWEQKSRYGMFSSVPVLLNEIWSTGQWWGAVIDSKTRKPSMSKQGATQLLFG